MSVGFPVLVLERLRKYKRTVMGNALKVLAFQCTETFPCGMAPRGHIKYESQYEHWLIDQTWELQTEGTGPFITFAMIPAAQVKECWLYGSVPANLGAELGEPGSAATALKTA